MYPHVCKFRLWHGVFYRSFTWIKHVSLSLSFTQLTLESNCHTKEILAGRYKVWVVAHRIISDQIMLSVAKVLRRTGSASTKQKLNGATGKLQYFLCSVAVDESLRPAIRYCHEYHREGTRRRRTVERVERTIENVAMRDNLLFLIFGIEILYQMWIILHYFSI